jgi:hypothetical protein
MNISICPNCKMRVLPKADGTCPSCQTMILHKGKGSPSKSIEPIKTSQAGLRLKQKPSSMAKTKAPAIAGGQRRTSPKSGNKIAIVDSNPQRSTNNTQNQEVMRQTNWKNSKIFCQSCGREAQTKYVDYYQNIGALVIRFTRRVNGYFCKNCSSKYFWSFTSTTLLLGWWGIISFFVSLFIIPNNIIRFLGTLSLKPPDPLTSFPVLTDIVIEKIQPYTTELFQRIKVGENFETVARSIAIRAVVSPGQVILYLFALTQALKEKKL